MRQAYTLIELLAVAAILAVVAAIGIPALARAMRRDPLAEALSLVQGFDRETRSIARHGPVLVECAGNALTRQRVASDPEARLVLDESIMISWSSTDGSPLRRFAVDARGRSEDVVVRLTSGSRELTAEVAGLTGEWRVQP